MTVQGVAIALIAPDAMGAAIVQIAQTVSSKLVACSLCQRKLTLDLVVRIAPTAADWKIGATSIMYTNKMIKSSTSKGCRAIS
jgi:hypothetical protein